MLRLCERVSGDRPSNWTFLCVFDWSYYSDIFDPWGVDPVSTKLG